jgi:hypothetical protein
MAGSKLANSGITCRGKCNAQMTELKQRTYVQQKINTLNETINEIVNERVNNYSNSTLLEGGCNSNSSNVTRIGKITNSCPSNLLNLFLGSRVKILQSNEYSCKVKNAIDNTTTITNDVQFTQDIAKDITDKISQSADISKILEVSSELTKESESEGIAGNLAKVFGDIGSKNLSNIQQDVLSDYQMSTDIKERLENSILNTIQNNISNNSQSLCGAKIINENEIEIDSIDTCVSKLKQTQKNFSTNMSNCYLNAIFTGNFSDSMTNEFNLKKLSDANQEAIERLESEIKQQMTITEKFKGIFSGLFGGIGTMIGFFVGLIVLFILYKIVKSMFSNDDTQMEPLGDTPYEDMPYDPIYDNIQGQQEPLGDPIDNYKSPPGLYNQSREMNF